MSRPSQSIEIEIDEDLLRAIERRALETGKSTSQVVEDAIRPYLSRQELLGIWENTEGMSEDKATGLALEAQRAARQKD